MSHISVQARFKVDDDAWPPEQPTSFTPLLLIHHKGHCTAEEVTTMAELMHTGSIEEVAMVTGEQSAVVCVKSDDHEKFHKMLDTSRATSSKEFEIEEILAPFESNTKSAFILIEGAPGIGKSVLLKEIAYKWGDNKQLLKKYELVFLRDPSLRQFHQLMIFSSYSVKETKMQCKSSVLVLNTSLIMAGKL